MLRLSATELAKSRQRLTPVQVFDLRGKCQAIVDKDVEDLAIGMVGKALTADVKSHYNPVTNRCYAEVATTNNLSVDFPNPRDGRGALCCVLAFSQCEILLTFQKNPESDCYVILFQ